MNKMENRAGGQGIESRDLCLEAQSQEKKNTGPIPRGQLHACVHLDWAAGVRVLGRERKGLTFLLIN